MKILSMTATFGKLEHQTLQLQPGLNVIHAPNEWGKSTWCGFIVAMLYGIDTKERTTLTALAAKERYAPWSGSPMSGRMDIQWNGRNITIERNTKGRSIFGVFRAYETDTGLEVSELTADNCGQTLLGVEKSVFTRAGFLRSADMPVTQDEALRKRLNALVSTGDDSGTAEALTQDLKELRNKIRTNRSNGLLPVAQAQKEELEGKLQELQTLQTQCAAIRQRQTQAEQYRRQLEAHQAALEYAKNQTQLEKLEATRQLYQQAQEQTRALEESCKQLPDPESIRTRRQQLQQLREQKDALLTQPLPQQTAMPEAPVAAFRGLTGQQAVEKAEKDAKTYGQDTCNASAFVGAALAAVGVAGLLIPHMAARIAGGALVLAAIILLLSRIPKARRSKEEKLRLQYAYAPIPPQQWVQAAQDYARQLESYDAQTEADSRHRAALEQKIADLQQQIDTLAEGKTLSQWEQLWEQVQQQYRQAEDARKEQNRLQELVQTMSQTVQQINAPAQPVQLELTQAQTERALADCEYEQRQLQLQLGNCQGRMETLGQQEVLQQQLAAVDARIAQLETTYDALTIAQETLADATAELQRRFAPRISKRAQELFCTLTDGRYDRLSLDADLAAYTAAAQEDTLHAAIWRSEGTMDQLYFALRLAVAEELTPDAPLVLDDALVRFDDTRAAAAMQILQTAAADKQVILFTCQQRENNMIKE